MHIVAPQGIQEALHGVIAVKSHVRKAKKVHRR